MKTKSKKLFKVFGPVEPWNIEIEEYIWAYSGRQALKLVADRVWKRYPHCLKPYLGNCAIEEVKKVSPKEIKTTPQKDLFN